MVQISDTHFGTELGEVMAALVSTIQELAPDVVLLTGDVTQRARRVQFDAARRFVDSLPRGAQRIVIPGNHDLPLFNLWARVTSPYAEYERAFGARESLLSRDGVAVLALDATHPRRHRNGALPPEHLRNRLVAARAACGAQGLLVVAVHQPLWTAWGADKEQTLIGRHESARLLSEARADMVLSGHVHVPLLATSAESDPQLPWRFLLSGAGTAVSHRIRPGTPNSFNTIECAPPFTSLRLARWDYTAPRFAVAAELRCRREPQRGWSATTPAAVAA